VIVSALTSDVTEAPGEPKKTKKKGQKEKAKRRQNHR
jgi:hypothetical protein